MYIVYCQKHFFPTKQMCGVELYVKGTWNNLYAMGRENLGNCNWGTMRMQVVGTIQVERNVSIYTYTVG